MTRREFIDELGRLLGELPDKERLDIIADHTALFLRGVEQGKSEQEIAAELGSPQEVARRILAGYRIQQAQADASIGNISRAILATVSLGVVNLVFVLGPFLALLGLLASFYAVAFSLLVAPLGILFIPSPLAETSDQRLFFLFASMVSLGLGGMLSIALIQFTIWLYRQFLRYLQFNVRLIRGK